MLKEKIASPALDLSIFRSYDIRGIVGKSLTEETVFLIGKTLGSIALSHGEEELAIGRDGRHSSPLLSAALSEGILSSGCNVVDIGMAPTPLLYYATHTLQTRSGVMLTGSHNPPDYNGLKMVMKGMALAEEEIKNIYHRIMQNDFLHGHGKKRDINLIDDYIQILIKNISLKKPLRIVIDAGNGVTGMIAPQLFSALGCEVHTLFCEVDGNFPNHHPDPSDTGNLQDLIAAVSKHKADIGLAFDGDGDRLGVVTTKGDIIWPDRLLMLFAKSILAAHKSKDKAKIIFDVKCTNHLPVLIQEEGGEALMWKTGHSLIKAKLAETNAQLAGEMSGHFFFKDRWYGFDDALYAGARLLEILSQENMSSDEIFSTIPNSINTPELKILVREEEKFQLMQDLILKANFTDAKDVMTIDGLRVNFAQGWGLVRPSNTTPYLILRFEALNEVILKEIQSLFRHWMLSVKPDLVLPF